MTKASDNEFPKVILTVSSDPSAPSDSDWKLFARANGIFARSSNTTVGPFTSSSGSSAASDVTIVDAGGYFTASQVEAALQELGAKLVPAPWAVVPDGGAPTVLDQLWVGANVAVFRPVTLLSAVTITGMYYRVGATSSGNVSVGLYDASLNRLATSGAVSCPATGVATTNFTSSYAASPGRYWLALSCDNGTATFIMSNISGQGTTLAKNATSAHPLPAGPVTVAATNTRAPAMVGLVSGGWAP